MKQKPIMVTLLMLDLKYVAVQGSLVVNPSLPWLGASPDGLVYDPNEPSLGLLEVKCPYTHRLSTIKEAASDPNFFAQIHKGKVTVKRSHNHHLQVQGQMALAYVSCVILLFTHSRTRGSGLKKSVLGLMAYWYTGSVFHQIPQSYLYLGWDADTINRGLFQL